MKTKDILELDYRNENEKEIIQKVLKQIKPLSRYSEEEDVSIKDLEKMLLVVCRKYNIAIKSITPDFFSGDSVTVWRCVLYDDISLKHYGYIYGTSTYEILAKTAILMFSEIKSGLKIRT